MVKKLAKKKQIANDIVRKTAIRFLFEMIFPPVQLFIRHSKTMKEEEFFVHPTAK